MARLQTYFLLFLTLISLSLATVPSFCKCTCFSQSGIIALNAPSTQPTSESPTDTDSPTDKTKTKTKPPSLLNRLHLTISPRSYLSPRSSTRAPTGSSTSASCTKCNRAFCLAQSLPFCTGAVEEDVFTACFQRDSEKDMFIVWGFILATVGLMGWAGVRRVMEKRREREGLDGGEYARVGR